MELSLAEMASLLEENGEYRVTERYRERGYYSEDDGSEKLIGVFLDVETTGVNSSDDKIIEIGLVSFEFSKEGRIYRILGKFDEYEDPGIPIPDEVVSLTGITDEMVRGRRINGEDVASFVAPAAIIIAHNAGFDRKFVERRFNCFGKTAWGCSMSQIPWQKEGIESSKLEYIAYRLGFFFTGHRANIDCLAGIHILASQLPQSKGSPLKALLDNARKTTYRIWAEDSPYDMKDILKGRGYRWNGGADGRPKAWYVDTTSDLLDVEKSFLFDDIYRREVSLRVDTINAFDRFSERA